MVEVLEVVEVVKHCLCYPLPLSSPFSESCSSQSTRKNPEWTSRIVPKLAAALCTWAVEMPCLFTRTSLLRVILAQQESQQHPVQPQCIALDIRFPARVQVTNGVRAQNAAAMPNPSDIDSIPLVNVFSP